MLESNFVLAQSIARRKVDIALGSDQESVSSVSDDPSCSSTSDSDNSDYSSPSSRAGAGRERRKGKAVIQSRRRSRICVLFDGIKEYIQSLFDISSLLRRPRVTGKYLHSTPSNSQRQQRPPKDDSLLAVVSSHDERHVKEKVLQWRCLSKSTREDPDLPASKASDFAVLQDTEWFCWRLAQANTKRREQLKYWERLPYETIKTRTFVFPELKQENEDVFATPERGAKSDGKLAMTSEIRSCTTQQTASAAHTFSTAHTYSTAAFSDVIQDSGTAKRAYTIYAPTTVGHGHDHANSVPDPPKTDDGITNFPCPYCGMELDTTEMQDRQAWK